MSRFHYWQFLINKEGQPIPDANITVYLAGTDTSAHIYFDEFGSNTTNEAPQVITNNMGYFEFWVGDASEEYGYQKGQKFKLEWEKPGVALGEIDWIDIFPHVAEVDETDPTSNAKNKVVSNKLAFRWEQHKDSTLQTDGFPIHGIEAVNELDVDTFSNKVISNFLAKRWNDHSLESFGTMPASATPHGLTPVDDSNDDNSFDKLISNKILFDINQEITTINDLLTTIGGGNAGNIFLPFTLGSTWDITHNFGTKYVSVTCFGTDDLEVTPKSIELTDMNNCTVTFHEPIQGYAVITGNVILGDDSTPPFEIVGDHGSLTGLLSDDHPIYALLDGTRPFTEPIGGETPVNPSHLATKFYVDDEISNILIDHSRISNSFLGDDHIQYVHIDGRRGFRNPITGVTPIEDSHLATKFYVDNNSTTSHGDLTNTAMDDHEQYVHIDGRRAFTHNISGIIPVAPDHLVTKAYVDGNIISSGNAGSFYLPFSVSDTWNISHNFGIKYVAVTIYDNADIEVRPAKIELDDLNNCTVYFDEPVQGYAVVTGNAISGSAIIPPFEIVGDHGSLTGLLSDDHTIYVLSDGTRDFTSVVGGVTPVNPNHLATKAYVDDEILTRAYPHSRISNSSVGDDHLQYIHRDGRRAFQNPIRGQIPIEREHLSTKGYVDDGISNTVDYIDDEISDTRDYIDSSIGSLVLSQILKYDETVTSWDIEGINYSKVINHDINEDFPVVMIWDTIQKEVIVPIKIESIDNDTIKVIVSTNNNMIVKVRT